MKKIFIYSIAMILLSAAISVFADASGDLSALLASTHSMTAHFSQQAIGKRSALRQNSVGDMAILKPNRFRWSITEPTRQLIVADGQRLWIYDIDLAQVTVQRFNQQINGSPALLLSGETKAVLKDFLVTETPQSPKSVQFNLKARSRNNNFQAVQLLFVNRQLEKMTLTDNLGQSSVVSFSQVKINPTLPVQFFIFKVPHGVDVIKQ